MDPELLRLLKEAERVLHEDRVAYNTLRETPIKRGQLERLASGYTAFTVESMVEMEGMVAIAQQRALTAIGVLEDVKKLLQRAEIRLMRSSPATGRSAAAATDVLVPIDATRSDVMVGNELLTYEGNAETIVAELNADGVRARVVRWTSAELAALRAARR